MNVQLSAKNSWAGGFHKLVLSARSNKSATVAFGYYTAEELAQLRDGITAYLNALPKSHVHAEKMMQYAKDATITDKPWELWEHGTDFGGGHEWINLRTHPSWSVNSEYRRKLDAMG